MKPVDVNPGMYIDFNKENDKESPKFKIGNNFRISKYENIFARCFIPNLCEEGFVIKKVKNTVSWTYVIKDIKGEEIVETFYK